MFREGGLEKTCHVVIDQQLHAGKSLQRITVHWEGSDTGMLRCNSGPRLRPPPLYFLSSAAGGA